MLRIVDTLLLWATFFFGVYRYGTGASLVNAAGLAA
jgi:hypothetical protein